MPGKRAAQHAISAAGCPPLIAWEGCRWVGGRGVGQQLAAPACRERGGPHMHAFQGRRMRMPSSRRRADWGSADGATAGTCLLACREHLGEHPCDKRRPIRDIASSFPAVDFSLVGLSSFLLSGCMAGGASGCLLRVLRGPAASCARTCLRHFQGFAALWQVDAARPPFPLTPMLADHRLFSLTPAMPCTTDHQR